MSAEYDEIRRQAVSIANREIHRPLRELIEVGMQNRGIAIDEYLHTAHFEQTTMDDPTPQGADDRRWCGAFIYYCYRQAAGAQRLPFSPGVLWGGRGLTIWAHRHPETIVDPNSEIQAGDIFATRNNHIGMAIGTSDAAHSFPTIEGNQGDLAHANYRGILRKRINTSSCRIIVRI